MKLQEINFLNVDKTLKSPEYKNIIYGAGRNGEYLLKLLDQQGVLVLAGRAVKDIVELYCREKQYFLNCFRGKLSGLNFIDAGAYTGDTLRESEVAQFIVI